MGRCNRRKRIVGRSNPKREETRRRIEGKLGIAKLRKQIDNLQKQVEAELLIVDAEYQADKERGLKEITHAIPALWSCETAAEAKELVQKVMDEYAG